MYPMAVLQLRIDTHTNTRDIPSPIDLLRYPIPFFPRSPDYIWLRG